MNKHISYRSAELLNSLNKSEKAFFTLNEAMNILSLSEPTAVRRLLGDMVKRGLLLRLKDGLYLVIPYDKDPSQYFPNWHLAAEAIAEPHNYYIGFYSALDIHGLITQPSLIEQIVTEKQIIPKHREIKKVKFEFITMGKRFFGYKKTWIDDFNKVNCSELEKTILDCLYMPVASNGIVEIIKAIYAGVKKLDQEKLLNYLKRFNSQAVNKRLGFILQNIDELKELRNEIAHGITSSYTILDPSIPGTGKHYSQWKIIDNIDISQALKSVGT